MINANEARERAGQVSIEYNISARERVENWLEYATKDWCGVKEAITEAANKGQYSAVVCIRDCPDYNAFKTIMEEKGYTIIEPIDYRVGPFVTVTW